MSLSHFSLFTGIGGIDLAAEQAGFHAVGMCEIDEYCRKVLDKHWPDVPKWRDIFELTGEEILDRCGPVALLSGGFPCQPFSEAGKRKGTADERHLWPEYLRIISEVKPRWVLGENVRGLLSIESGSTFGTILSDLAESGYRVGWLCYGAGDVGAPHKRERVFIVAYSEGAGNRRQQGQRGFADNECDASIGAKIRGITNNSNSQNGTMADTGSMGRSEGSTCEGKIRQEVGGTEPNIGDTEQYESQTDRSTQSSMGRVPSRLSPGMDGNWPAGKWPTPATSDSWFGGCSKETVLNSMARGTRAARHQLSATVISTWPAGPGEQYEWEPLRIATGIKDRVARLKALGNAVVPQQAYPIFKAINDIESQWEG